MAEGDREWGWPMPLPGRPRLLQCRIHSRYDHARSVQPLVPMNLFASLLTYVRSLVAIFVNQPGTPQQGQGQQGPGW